MENVDKQCTIGWRNRKWWDKHESRTFNHIDPLLSVLFLMWPITNSMLYVNFTDIYYSDIWVIFELALKINDVFKCLFRTMRSDCFLPRRFGLFLYPCRFLDSRYVKVRLLRQSPWYWFYILSPNRIRKQFVLIVHAERKLLVYILPFCLMTQAPQYFRTALHHAVV